MKSTIEVCVDELISALEPPEHFGRLCLVLCDHEGVAYPQVGWYSSKQGWVLPEKTGTPVVGWAYLKVPLIGDFRKELKARRDRAAVDNFIDMLNDPGHDSVTGPRE